MNALDAMKRALEEYPGRNTHQLQARKVCEGVLALAAITAALPTQSAGVEERARELLKRTQEEMGVTFFSSVSAQESAAIRAIAAALRTPASEGDGGRVVATVCLRGDTYAHGLMTELQVQHEEGVTFPIGTKFYTTPPTQQEARAVDDVQWPNTPASECVVCPECRTAFEP